MVCLLRLVDNRINILYNGMMKQIIHDMECLRCGHRFITPMPSTCNNCSHKYLIDWGFKKEERI